MICIVIELASSMEIELAQSILVTNFECFLKATNLIKKKGVGDHIKIFDLGRNLIFYFIF